MSAAQYLSDFFSTLPPAAPQLSSTALPALSTNYHASSLPMSNAFKSLSPVENSPFFFDDAASLPVDTPALEVDDGGDLSNFTSPIWSSLSLFPDAALQQQQQQQFGDIPQTVSPVDLALPLPSFDEAPLAQGLSASTAFDIEVVSTPALSRSTSSSASPAPSSYSTANKRKRASAASTSTSTSSTFNGTRNTSIPLLDEVAPTQKRVYRGPPSKTSKREVPAAAAKKVAALKSTLESKASEVDPDEIHEEIEKSIEEKRRQNTVAARRSRMRKAEHLTNLENRVEELETMMREKELEMRVWKERALAAGWNEDFRAP